jgi:hypothetical protein
MNSSSTFMSIFEPHWKVVATKSIGASEPTVPETLNPLSIA